VPSSPPVKEIMCRQSVEMCEMFTLTSSNSWMHRPLFKSQSRAHLSPTETLVASRLCQSNSRDLTRPAIRVAEQQIVPAPDPAPTPAPAPAAIETDAGSAVEQLEEVEVDEVDEVDEDDEEEAQEDLQHWHGSVECDDVVEQEDDEQRSSRRQQPRPRSQRPSSPVADPHSAKRDDQSTAKADKGLRVSSTFSQSCSSKSQTHSEPP